MKNINIKKLLFYILFPLSLGVIVGIITKDDQAYLDTLNKNIDLPKIVFPIVWSVLYVLMGIWAYSYEKNNKNNEKVLTIYYISLLVNLIFSPILFTMQNLILATIDVILLIGLIMYLTYVSFKDKKKYGFLLIPYLIWLFLALALMIDLVVNNM